MPCTSRRYRERIRRGKRLSLSTDDAFALRFCQRQGSLERGFHRPVYYDHEECIEFEMHASLEMPSLRVELDDEDCDVNEPDALSFAIPVGKCLPRSHGSLARLFNQVTFSRANPLSTIEHHHHQQQRDIPQAHLGMSKSTHVRCTS